MSEATVQTATDRSLAPSAPAPSGPPPDWDSDTDLLWVKAEIEKSTDIPPRPADWARLLEVTGRLLAVTKDWLLLCAHARATIHLHGVAALPASLEALTLEVRGYWPDISPALPRGLTRRANYLTWFIEGAAEALKARPITSGTESDVLAAEKNLAELDELLRPLMRPVPYPGVRALRIAIQELKQPKAEIRETRETPAPTPPPAPTPVPAVAPEFPPPITDIDSADRVLSKVRKALFATADALQKIDAADPAAYRYRRLGAWLRIDGVSPSGEGRLPFNGPDTDKCAKLRPVLDTDSTGVLAEAEGLLEPFPLCLDANYLSFLALSRSGAKFKAARDTVRSETLALVTRIPGLMELDFANGVAVAAPDTREWLQAEIAKTTVPPGGVDGAPGVTEPIDCLSEAQRTAQELAAQGSIHESFQIFHDGIREAASGRERFRWRIAAARHAAHNSRADLALDLLDGLDREAKELRLDVWEPELWADVLGAVLELGKKGRRDRVAPEALERLPDIEKRLARLDLMAAVTLANGRA